MFNFLQKIIKNLINKTITTFLNNDYLFDTLFLTREVADELLNTAKDTVHDANDLFQFTEVINAQYSYEEKVSLIESLWKVAYSDQQLDKYEEHMVRRIADLLYVSHSDFIQTRNRIKNGL